MKTHRVKETAVIRDRHEIGSTFAEPNVVLRCRTASVYGGV